MTINELIKRATKDLLVKKDATSKYRLSKISAPDDNVGQLLICDVIHSSF
jgi:hypothetical protein